MTQQALLEQWRAWLTPSESAFEFFARVATHCILDKEFGGLEGRVLLIDLDRKFDIVRVLQMTCDSPSDLTRQLPDVDALVSGWDDALKSVAAAKQLGIIATKHAIFDAADQPQPRVFLASWEHQDRRLYFDIEDKGLSLLE
ncbi:hypothetical protein QBZ16_004757 [Prototheca wickerhamii]|uniref:Uncharacterized protein n=1 Tax=Prototheca wickerhamii TaxID=3111 RepID=A0AAD9IF85_PROWI|nr:hypothetical protein QBZ16_004757 [Prototheca wickerhamii]